MSNKALNYLMSVLLVATLAVFLYGCQAATTDQDDKMMDDMGEWDEAVEEDGEMINDDWTDKEMKEMMDQKGGEMMMEELEGEKMEIEAYKQGDSSDYEAWVAAGQPFALFFHASWCPTCQAMEKDFIANWSQFPEGAMLLQVDYDKETELKKKYGITVQSTVVFIDKEGNQVGKTLLGASSQQMINMYGEIL